MPKKKNTPKNAFYFYMVDLQEEERRQGNNYNMKQIADIAGPKFKLLPPVDKQYYERKAQEHKSAQRKHEGRLDSYGNSVDETLRQEEEMIKEEENMYQSIQFKIRYLGSKQDVANESWYFLSTKIFCVTDEGEHIPAEMALVKYSIAEGIMNEYHCFIDPGPLPLGYSFECKETSDKTHKIPPQNFELANNKYKEILDKILLMLSPDSIPDSFPILYVSTKEITQTKAILEWLQYKAGMKKCFVFNIYDTTALMMELLRYLSKQMFSIAIVHDWLDVSSFIYYEQTCCRWHVEQDSYEHCALGTVKRTCYVFSDHLCCDFNITPLPNRHLPERVEDQLAPLPPQFRVDHSHSLPRSPKPTITHNETTGIVKNVKSKFNNEEEKIYVPSAAAELFSPSGSARTNSSGATSAATPLRVPKSWSFADATIAKLPSSQPHFMLNEEEFPGLDVGSLTLDDTQSESSLSVSSLGNQSSSSLPSVSSSVGTATSWRSSVGSSRNQNPLPIGRGIGRGRPLAKK